MSHDAILPILPILIIILVILTTFWRRNRARTMLEDWVRENGYELLSQEECWFFRGPFFWGTSKGQIVYKVSLRGPDGMVRNGYARCGGYWLGLWTQAVEVRWDD